MKVVLKPSILKMIEERITAAKQQRREVDHILVSPDEYNQLRCECFHELKSSFSYYTDSEVDPVQMTTKVITLEEPAKYDYRKLSFYSTEKLFGYDLYVVPKRFCQ